MLDLGGVKACAVRRFERAGRGSVGKPPAGQGAVLARLGKQTAAAGKWLNFLGLLPIMVVDLKANKSGE